MKLKIIAMGANNTKKLIIIVTPNGSANGKRLIYNPFSANSNSTKSL
jgi:hypothetical protein